MKLERWLPVPFVPILRRRVTSYPAWEDVPAMAPPGYCSFAFSFTRGLGPVFLAHTTTLRVAPAAT